MITYLLFMINNVSSKYDHIVEKITKANAYNIGFKEDIDYVVEHLKEIISNLMAMSPLFEDFIKKQTK